MKKAVFTIVAKNYIGLATVLRESVLKNSDCDFFIFVSDEPSEQESLQDLPSYILWSKEELKISEELWYQMAFKYNLIEFCTAIKPFCIEYLAEQKGYSKVIYLDPDVYVFNSLEDIFSDLDKSSVVITPHIVDMHPAVKTDHPEYLFLVNGTFNLGFFGWRKSEAGQNMLTWWKKMLVNENYFDNDRGTATDQKWINLLPAFLEYPDLCVCRNKGLNLAPWNFHERKIVEQGDVLFVEGRNDASEKKRVPLIFAHFSGYDYNSLGQSRIVHKNTELNKFSDTELLFDRYAKALETRDFNKYSGLAYTYNTFENGKNILSLHRRLYRRLLEEQKNPGTPFKTEDGSFYSLLKRKKLIDNSALQADKVTGKTISGFDRKLGRVNWMAKMIKRLLGIRRYSILTRFLRRYFKEENQLFLIDKEEGKKIW